MIFLLDRSVARLILNFQRKLTVGPSTWDTNNVDVFARSLVCAALYPETIAVLATVSCQFDYTLPMFKIANIRNVSRPIRFFLFTNYNRHELYVAAPKKCSCGGILELGVAPTKANFVYDFFPAILIEIDLNLVERCRTNTAKNPGMNCYWNMPERFLFPPAALHRRSKFNYGRHQPHCQRCE